MLCACSTCCRPPLAQTWSAQEGPSHGGFGGISLTAGDAEHLFTNLMAISVSSRVKYLLSSLAHFYFGYFPLCVIGVLVFFIYQIKFPHQIHICKKFPPFLGCFFIFFIVCLKTQNILILGIPFCLFFFPVLLMEYLKAISNSHYQGNTCMFSSKNFIVLPLAFSSLHTSSSVLFFLIFF